MTEWEFLYWAAIGGVWGWTIATWATLSAPAIERAWSQTRIARAMNERAYRRWFESLPEREQEAFNRVADRMSEIVRATGLTAQEATEAFSRFR
jgi:hypothetical protein